MTQEDIGFSQRRFSTLTRISENHFWFAGRQALVHRILGHYLTEKVGKALDVGCGPGIWMESWHRYAHDVCGIDPFATNVDPATLGDGIRIVTGVATKLPVADDHAGLVIALDVLEHVDDFVAMQEISRTLLPGGYALITVPAFPWLWSYRDVDADHLRRYTRNTLLAPIEKAGLQIRHVQYYQGLLFPLVVMSRFFGRRGPRVRDAEDHPPARLNQIMRSINLLEVNAGLKLPFGSSLLALAQKTT